MFYLNTIEHLFLLVEQLDQLAVCLPYSRLLAGIPILAVFQNLRWNSNKTPLVLMINPIGVLWVLFILAVVMKVTFWFLKYQTEVCYALLDF